MTAKLGSAITNKVMQRISGPAGLKAALGTLAMPGSAAAAVLGTAQVRAQNVAADLAERSGSAQYPAINATLQRIQPKHAEDEEYFRAEYADTLQELPDLKFIVDIVDADDRRRFGA